MFTITRKEGGVQIDITWMALVLGGLAALILLLVAVIIGSYLPIILDQPRERWVHEDFSAAVAEIKEREGLKTGPELASMR